MTANREQAIQRYNWLKGVHSELIAQENWTQSDYNAHYSIKHQLEWLETAYNL